MKKFSVIVPIYNVGFFLRECIQSVLIQTYTDFELILVDDGSTDDCPKMCDQFENDIRIRVIHKPNGGLVSARKAGVAEATGKYAVCLDGDDWLHKDFLKEMSEVIDQFDPDIVCCGYYNTDGKNEISIPFVLEEGIYDRERLENEVFPLLIESKSGMYFPPSVWAKCFKMSIYRHYQMLVDEKVKIGEDMACTRPIVANSESLYVIKKPLYYYRQNPTSMTKERKAFNWNGPMIIGKHLESVIDMGRFSFREQNYRFITHNLFLVSLSQFNRKDGYNVIARDIVENISEPYYVAAIKKANFRLFTKGYIARFCLRWHLTTMMYLLNKIYNH